MAITINTNVSALFAQQYLSENQNNLSNTLQRMSSGKRINNASDDPAGLAIAATMQKTINGLRRGSQNGQDGVNMIQTAQGAMQVILNDLQTMNTLAVQAANGTNGTQDLANLDAQYQALLGEIDRTASNTNFNGVDILGGGSIAIQIGFGATANDVISVGLLDTSTGSAALNVAGTDLTSQTNATTAITSLGTAINTVTTGLASIGADSVNLQAAISSNNTYATNLTAAQSNIQDADMALESSNMAKFNILNQADTAMLAQANSMPSLVLQLLRG